MSRLLTDPRGTPLEAGVQVRTVPAGLHRALQIRDHGCAGDGCDVAAQYCQVMHLGVPYRLDGRLTLATAALGCAFHHTRYDRHGWTATWIDGRPVIHHPHRPPATDQERADGPPALPAPRHGPAAGPRHDDPPHDGPDDGSVQQPPLPAALPP